MKRKLFLITVVIFALLLCLLPVWHQKAADEENLQERMLRSAVRIQTDGHYGSGSIYEVTDKEIIVVTNRHVLTYFHEESYVTFFDGKNAAGRILFMDETADVGFVSISASAFSKEELKSYRQVRSVGEAFEKLKKNDVFYMVNAADDRENPVYYEGGIVEKEKYLEDFKMEMIYGDGYAVPGMSGCGVFDEQGNYIGMLAGSTEYGEIAAVPGNVIEEVYVSCRS